MIQQMRISRPGVYEMPAVDNFVQLEVGMPKNYQVCRGVELREALAEGAHVYFSPGDQQAQVVQGVLPHAHVPMREHDMNAIYLKALFFGQLDAPQPVAISLHGCDRRDALQFFKHSRNADIPGMQDGFGLEGAKSFWKARVQVSHPVANVSVRDDDKAAVRV